MVSALQGGSERAREPMTDPDDEIHPMTPEEQADASAFQKSLTAWAAEQEREGDSTTRYVPTREPWRSQWCRLHALHVVALARAGQQRLPPRSGPPGRCQVQAVLRKCDAMSRREDVRAFHEAMGVPVLSTPQVPSDERVRLRMRLIAEEFFETFAAVFPTTFIAGAHLAVIKAIDNEPIEVEFPEFIDGLVDIGNSGSEKRRVRRAKDDCLSDQERPYMEAGGLMILKVLRVGSHALPLPTYAKPGDAGMDLRACLDKRDLRHTFRDGHISTHSSAMHNDAGIQMQHGAKVNMPCGFAFEIPPGHEGQVRGRSGLAMKQGVYVSHFGTIDHGYSGEVFVQVWNQSGETFTIAHGDRVAQIIVAPVARCEVIEAAELSDTARGASGFGSTGAK